MGFLDIAIFIVFLVGVIGFGLFSSRQKEKSSEGYFLAGRGLRWWLIGFSLIAANISAEQFVGMTGAAAKDHVGLSIASYEWVAAVTLVLVAFFFLPKFLRAGIYTIPEFLEYRYSRSARTIMSLLMMITLVCVNITTVIYLGAKFLKPLIEDLTLFGWALDIPLLSWIVGISAAVYVMVGGLKACAWTDLFWGSSLIVGGGVIMILTFQALAAPEDYEEQGIDAAAVTKSIASGEKGIELAEDASFGQRMGALKEKKMHMATESTNTELPWTALLLGIWIPNFYYWGLNQYIMQRTLGAQSLADGQRGVVFAAALKLIIPFVVCVPGVLAFALFAPVLQQEASDGGDQKETLARFEEVRSQPAKSEVLFKFNDDFEALYPDQAEALVTFNAAVVGSKVSPRRDQTVGEWNKSVLKTAEIKKLKLTVQTELIGYDYDAAFPTLVARLAPAGVLGFVLAAIMGAVVSSLAAMLNATSTIFTMDIYKEFLNPLASQRVLVWVGRLCIPICVVVGCSLAPFLANPEFKGAFHYIQEFQGYMSPGILTVFLFGMFVSRSPRKCGVVGLVLSPIIYGILALIPTDLTPWTPYLLNCFLNRMAITVGVLAVVLTIITLARPLSEPVTLPEQTKINMESSGGAKVFAVVIVIATAALYWIFW